MASSKIKYAKLRLFKPSPSARGDRNSNSPLENGECPKSPPLKTIEQMEGEIIDLSVEGNDKDVEADKTIVKRTRVDSLESTDKPMLKLPKLPKKPQEEGIIGKFFKPSEDDFEDTKKESVPKRKANAQKSTKPRKPKAPRRPKDQSDIRKVFKKYKDSDGDQLLQNLMLEHSVADRLDPEQLQIALAMSRSLVDQSGGSQVAVEPIPVDDEAQDSFGASSGSIEERRIQGIRATLEQYGFKCKSSYNDYDLNVMFGTKAAKPKNTRKFKLKRPTQLVRRDRGGLVAFMTAQAERLLKEELQRPLADCTDVNIETRTYGSNIFWMNQNGEESGKIMSEYYVEGLMEVCSVKAGYLLKDWKLIPGRDVTPERELITGISEEERHEIIPQFVACEPIENEQDALLDMDTVSEEYNQKYNHEAPVCSRDRTNLVIPSTPKRSASPELFASDSGDEERIAGTHPIDLEDEVCETAVNNDDEEPNSVNTSANLRCTSSENIFDDTDPIVHYELYSSDEVKISTTGQEKSTSDSPSPHGRPLMAAQRQEPIEKDAVILLSSEENSNHAVEQQKTIQSASKRAPTTAIDSGIMEKEQRLDGDSFISPGKNLSFHALALQYKLRHVSLDNVETINLEVDGAEEECVGPETGENKRPDEGGEGIPDPISNHSEISMHSNATDEHSDCDVMIVSDDEVNYSVRQEHSILYNDSPIVPDYVNDQSNKDDNPGEDLDSTKEYFNIEEFKNLQAVVNASQVMTDDVHSISSDEEVTKEGIETTHTKANNTMAFLDGLVAKFNLTPVTNHAGEGDTPKHCALDDYLENYEIPDFTVEIHEDAETAPLTTPAPIPSEQLDQEIEHILNRAQETCSQMPSSSPQSKPIKRTISDSALLVSKKSKPRQQSVKEKFKTLTAQIEPEPSEYEIRLENVSPRPEYDGMSSPQLERELYKYGLKQASRSKAVKVLNFMYDQLHPLVEVVEVEEEADAKGEEDLDRTMGARGDRLVETMDGLKLVEKGAFVPEMENEDYILPSKPRKKTFWCAVPLHIAFYNMVKLDSRLHQQILSYQPIELEAVYNHLKEIGLRYETNDLIAFLDRRCITFRTAQPGGGRTKKPERKKN
ncbi:structure-specific endonuclease subunit SLX4 [Toxorhynchites rutilus septentrionalis]|uniref:structure-specific endonuclease subunit SLX4 n=1 Tax=Toxorhynchites rutilus septentrionalis TaxID=329112 RepID=UPI002479EF20|nr:structure-specific endonuclease subunit SLX4 [Toxorhynchites rutilus septentrionalis]